MTDVNAPDWGACQIAAMPRRTLAFIALAISMLYGVTVGVAGDHRTVIAPIGGVLVALAWIAVGVFGRDDGEPRKDPAA